MRNRSWNERARQKAYKRGVRAEWVAACLLRLKGYRLLERRARTPCGEIDLIVTRGGSIVFVEVKRRATREEALMALRARQQARIVRAAQYWLLRYPRLVERGNYRFDMIVVQPYQLPLHIADAFPASLAGPG